MAERPQDDGAASAAVEPLKEEPEQQENTAPVDKGKGRAQDTDGDEGMGIEEDMDEEARLALLTTVRDQDDLERDIGRQADQMLTEREDERDNKRIQKAYAEKQRSVAQLKRLEDKLAGPGGSTIKNKVRADIAEIKERIAGLDEEVRVLENRITERHRTASGDHPLKIGGNVQQANETRRDFLIRTGKITPFSKMAQVPRISSSLADTMFDAEEGEKDLDEALEQTQLVDEGPRSHRNLKRPGFMDEEESDTGEAAPPAKHPPKRRRLQSKLDREAESSSDLSSPPEDDSDKAFEPDMDDKELATLGESEEGEVDDIDDDDFDITTPGRKRKAPRKTKGKTKQVKSETTEDEQEDLTGVDDGNEQVYQARLNSWVKRRGEARRKAKAKRAAESVDETDKPVEEESTESREEEWFRPHPTRPDATFEGGFKVPGDIYPSLFDYQKIGVQWMWELYSQEVGGIVGDEMGLGKTIQVISFLAGLHYSKKINKPIIVVCPATVMKQWVNEFHQWWPPLRVSILHSSGSGMMDVKRESRIEEELETRQYDSSRTKLTKSEKAAKNIVDKVKRDGHVLVTTYSGLQSYARFLIPTDWEYAVLDEGHKIRNPNAGITIYCKELRTANRLILSGTPMQNNLTELWSLFDFVFPMRLGTLVDFRNHFEFPIKQGGYANASTLQIQTAARCAETLKETISGYLLQRCKSDVAADLPKKSERVLFCKLTKTQREAYEDFLESPEMRSIMDGRRQALYGIDILRKICNHPDLVQHKTHHMKPNYGNGTKSGKMQVVKALLEMWMKNGHKTLLFAQHRIMLDILEKFVKKLGNFNYMRMDGSTNIKDRQDLVDKFNNDPNQHVFLLTTKVGGLGVNLTGADRVLIYDPDWNPSTDVQARERAWRLGQKREVEIYRLMTAGTIEEKIYHRQIFKQFLTNKILRDPTQRQTFQLKDLHDLFTLGDAENGETETGTLFKGTETRFDQEGEQQSSETTEHITNITGISRDEAYRTSADEAAPPNDGTANQTAEGAKDDRLLNTIFARSGVHAAVSHDTIIGSNSRKPKVVADPEIIAREARRVAAEAARELQRSGEAARAVPIGTPTWTGIVGTAGRPEEQVRPRSALASRRGGLGAGRGGRGGAGPSSSSVLANLAARQGGGGRRGTPLSSAPSRDSPSVSRPAAEGAEFLEAIKNFLRVNGGMRSTQELVNHFSRLCDTAQRVANFKEILKEIAILNRGSGSRGRGKWVLREEYR
ncbi:uncharacterized protein K452DRAFT_293300 [Aplosporella prunicola CBS 121167]|uniref:DNA repair protein Rhp26/Rad26 n=1 Tax=Aplosporella prunicola CBS 121167 TaxID=1176127 RepID=A0A6A6AVT4_9PEZI|nr:uncharacterized protein K452DRAFT_293300 [Aplosporella prunicola CBS 121167]KAF2135338.1 hypothetical protein K452DRAFT_293300 [Aplosporella prunicola CBS 121167]